MLLFPLFLSLSPSKKDYIKYDVEHFPLFLQGWKKLKKKFPPFSFPSFFPFYLSCFV